MYSCVLNKSKLILHSLLLKLNDLVYFYMQLQYYKLLSCQSAVKTLKIVSFTDTFQ